MKKKLLLVLLVFVALFTITGCDSKKAINGSIQKKILIHLTMLFLIKH